MKKYSWLVICWLVIVGLFGRFKPLPGGVNLTGSIYSVSADSLHFLKDKTYVNLEEKRFSEQEIFDEILEMIDEAEHYVLIDMFLYNDFLGTETKAYRQLSSELTEALIKKKSKILRLLFKL